MTKGDKKRLIVRLGNIIDTSALYDLSWQRIAQSIGGHVTEDQQRKLRGVEMDEALDKMLLWNSIGLNPNHKEILAGKAQALFIRLGCDEEGPFYSNSVSNFVRSAKSEGFALAILSTNETESLLISELGWSEMVQVWIQDFSNPPNEEDHGWLEQLLKEGSGSPSDWVLMDRNPEILAAASTYGFKTVGVGASSDFDIADQILPDYHAKALAELKK